MVQGNFVKSISTCIIAAVIALHFDLRCLIFLASGSRGDFWAVGYVIGYQLAVWIFKAFYNFSLMGILLAQNRDFELFKYKFV